MRTYTIIVEAKLTLEDYMDELDLHEFNKSRTIAKLTDEDEDEDDWYEDEYKFYLALWNITTPEELEVLREEAQAAKQGFVFWSPYRDLAKADLEAGINVLDLLAVNTTIFPSKGEARKMLVGGGIGINKVKLEDAEASINATQLLNDRYLLVQKGKKNYFLIISE